MHRLVRSWSAPPYRRQPWRKPSRPTRLGRRTPVQTGSAAPIASAQKQPPSQRFDIDDFAVQGADKLLQIEIEEAIYPF